MADPLDPDPQPLPYATPTSPTDAWKGRLLILLIGIGLVCLSGVPFFLLLQLTRVYGERLVPLGGLFAAAGFVLLGTGLYLIVAVARILLR
jgi:hypothetical protein